MITKLEESRQNSRLIAMNLALEAISMGESGRQLFEFACQTLDYTDSQNLSENFAAEPARSNVSDPDTNEVQVSVKISQNNCNKTDDNEELSYHVEAGDPDNRSCRQTGPSTGVVDLKLVSRNVKSGMLDSSDDEMKP